MGEPRDAPRLLFSFSDYHLLCTESCTDTDTLVQAEKPNADGDSAIRTSSRFSFCGPVLSRLCHVNKVGSISGSMIFTPLVDVLQTKKCLVNGLLTFSNLNSY